MNKFHFDTTQSFTLILKKQMKLQLLMRSNVSDDVTDFEIVDLSKTQKSNYLNSKTLS